MPYVTDETREVPATGFVVELARDLRELVRLELALARAELRTALADARTGAILLGAGAVVAALGLAMLPVGIALAVGLALPLWAAFLIVGGGLLAIGLCSGAVGLWRLKRVDPVPHRAISLLQPRRVADELAGA